MQPEHGSSSSLPLSSDGPVSAQTVIQHVFSTTSCYDLMQASSKGTVFETTIPFQLAFFALIEHETDVAPLWDPELRSFVGLMTIQDYITALRVCILRNINAMELTAKSISDMLLSAAYLFKHQGFHAIDAEDSVLQLCLLMFRNNSDYVPVVDPENGNLISILGALDILHLLDQVAKTNEHIFGATLAHIGVGTYNINNNNDNNNHSLYLVSKQTSINEILDNLDKRNLSAVPIVEADGRVVAMYHRSDVSFIMKAADPETVLNNLRSFKVEDAMAIKEAMIAAGEIAAPPTTSGNIHGLVTCKLNDTISTVLRLMVANRSHRVVIVDDSQRIRGIISFRDILMYFIESNLR